MVEKKTGTHTQARQAQGANRAERRHPRTVQRCCDGWRSSPCRTHRTNMAVEIADGNDDAAEVACAATDVVGRSVLIIAAVELRASGGVRRGVGDAAMPAPMTHRGGRAMLARLGNICRTYYE